MIHGHPSSLFATRTLSFVRRTHHFPACDSCVAKDLQLISTDFSLAPDKLYLVFTRQMGKRKPPAGTFTLKSVDSSVPSGHQSSMKCQFNLEVSSVRGRIG